MISIEIDDNFPEILSSLEILESRNCISKREHAVYDGLHYESARFMAMKCARLAMAIRRIAATLPAIAPTSMVEV
jgi:hypothetical protein